MANTTDSITLNGYDWSNLYHIDYSGGTGGEKLAETIANIVHAQSNVDWRTGEEGTANYGVEDSVFNQKKAEKLELYLMMKSNQLLLITENNLI